MGDIQRSNGRVEEAFRTHQGRLLEFIRRRVNSAEDAEDIFQDVLYRLMASDSIMTPIEELAAWLFAAARNRIVDWYRQKRRRDVRLDSDIPEGQLAIAEVLVDPTGDPDTVYTQSLIWEEVLDALGDLPTVQREVFVMHELEGMSFKEIAEQTGVPLNTLLSRKRYAVLFLRDRLQELYSEL